VNTREKEERRHLCQVCVCVDLVSITLTFPGNCLLKFRTKERTLFKLDRSHSIGTTFLMMVVVVVVVIKAI
jgi:hypothetical protein